MTDYKPLRGGSWNTFPRYCRSAVRSHLLPGEAYDRAGFRVVCKLLKTSEMTNPKLLRGGSWYHNRWSCPSAYRVRFRPDRTIDIVGFRVVCRLPKTSEMTDCKQLRGGSWLDFPRDCRSAHRYRNQPFNANFIVGFRVVCLPQITQQSSQMLQEQVNQLDGFVTELTIFRKNATDRVFSLSWNPGLDTVVVTDGSQAICVTKEQINAIANGVVMMLDQSKANE